MELKNLLTKFKSKEETPEHFFALELSEDSVKSAVWTVLNGHTKVVKIGSVQAWDGQDKDKLLTAADQSISSATDNLIPEPTGIIFGLPETWLDKEDINQEKKSLLKFICQELDLKPLGFVVTDTAVIQYLKIEEGTPPSAIFIQLHSSEINLSLVKLGKVIGSQIVGRSGDLSQDVEEGLSRFKDIDTLPARMLLYDDKSDFEEDKQQLISYDWEEKLPFIHFPKVEALPQEASIKAVALAGGSEVAKSLGFEIKPQPKPETPETTAAALGFVTGQDISDTLTARPEPEIPSQPEPETPQPLASTPPPTSTFISNLIQSIQPVANQVKNQFQIGLKKLKAVKKTPRLITLIGLGFFLIFIAVFSAYWYLPKASVTILVEPQTIDENLTLTINPKATTLDPEKGILPGETVSVSVEGNKSVPTTGKNLVGDPAQGDITIYNKTAQTKTFAKGAVLIGPDNLAFILDQETTVASRSASEDSDGIITITPGKADAKLTAKSIGPEGNLSAGTKLTFKQYTEDDCYAKTSSGLAGGTAREVKAVSQEDQAGLLNSLTAELKTKAEQTLQTQLGEGKSIVDIDKKDQAISKTFNHDIGEETDTLTLTAKLEYAALAYRQNDLDLLLTAAIKGKVPDNFMISSSSETDIQSAKLQTNGTATVDIAFKAKMVPKMDFDDIKKNLKGRYPDVVQSYLTTLPSFIKADITITPNLPKQLKTFPRLAKNIFIEIKTAN